VLFLVFKNQLNSFSKFYATSAILHILIRPTLGYFGAASLMATDGTFAMARRTTSQQISAHGLPVYTYFFDAQTANLSPQKYGVAHFTEIPFVFGNSQGVGWEIDPVPADTEKSSYDRLAETVSRMWISFAATHSPNNHKRTYSYAYS
jgi:carboxylesterase type B